MVENVSVLGNVIFYENFLVWFNVVLCGDNDLIMIGENLNI